jgi:hypothetical protein
MILQRVFYSYDSNAWLICFVLSNRPAYKEFNSLQWIANVLFVLERVFEETSISILSTADILREKLAFITGGTSHGCPILTFPDNPQVEFTQDKYKKLIDYLTKLPK